MDKATVAWTKILLLILLFASGCAHSLEARYKGDNLAFALTQERLESQLVVGIRSPNINDKYGEILYNSFSDALNRSGNFSRVIQNFNQPTTNVDILIEVEIHNEYSTDPLNFFIQWPGTLIFAAWWNGLIYYNDISTSLSITNVKTGEKKLVSSEDRFKINYTNKARGIWAGSMLGWLLYTAPGFITAVVPSGWDDTMKRDTFFKIREEYGKIIAQQTIQALRL